MAVQEQTPLREYTANGVTTSFALGFDCEETNHLIVTIDDVEVLPTDWYLSGSNVVFWTAPGNGKLIKLQRNTPFNRLADYQSYNNSFRPPAINKDFDRIWWKLQELGVADWILSNRISALKAYVDDRDDELRAYLLEEIRKQGVALDQLDEYYNYLMERLAQIAVDKGWDASFVVDGNENQHQINNSLIRTYNSVSDLLNIPNPRHGQSAFVKHYDLEQGILGGGGTFVYNSSRVSENDGGTVFNGWVRQFQGDIQSDWFGVIADATSGAVGTDCVQGFQKAIDAAYSHGVNVDFNAGKYRCVSLTYIPDGYFSEWYFFRLRPNVKINIDKQCTLIAADGIVASNANEQGTKGFIFFSDAKTDCPNAEVTGGGTLDHNGQNNLLQPINGWGNQSTTPTFLLSANSHSSKFHHLIIKNNPGHNHLINEKSEDVLFHNNTVFEFGDAIAGNVHCADHSVVYSRGKRCKAFNNIVINNTHSYVTCAFEMHADGCEAYNNYVKNVSVLGLGASYTEADIRNQVTFRNNVGVGLVSSFGVDVAANCELILHLKDNIGTISGTANNPADPYGRVGHDYVTIRLPNNAFQPRNLEIYDSGNTITWETPVAWTPSDYGNCAARVVRKVAKWVGSGNTFIGLQGDAAYFGASSIGAGSSQNAEISFSDRFINCGRSIGTAYNFSNDGLNDYISLPKRVVINDEFENCLWGSIYTNGSQVTGITFAPQRFELNVKSDNYHVVKNGFNAPDSTSCEYNIEMSYLTEPSDYVTLPTDNPVSGEIRIKSPKNNEFMRFRKFSGVNRWKMNRIWYDETLPTVPVNPFGDKNGDELELFTVTPTGATRLVCVADGVGGVVGTWKKAGQVY